jgi:hypothetical protein
VKCEDESTPTEHSPAHKTISVVTIDNFTMKNIPFSVAAASVAAAVSTRASRAAVRSVLGQARALRCQSLHQISSPRADVYDLCAGRQRF